MKTRADYLEDDLEQAMSLLHDLYNAASHIEITLKYRDGLRDRKDLLTDDERAPFYAAIARTGEWLEEIGNSANSANKERGQ